MDEDAHHKAVSHLLRSCQELHVRSILAYGSYARGDYRPESDVDLLVVLDSNTYSHDDIRRLVAIGKLSREQFKISLNMDIMLDSEIELWNRGILLEGHSFIDLSFYDKDGRVLFGEDVRERLKLPQDLEEKAKILLGIVQSEFKRWLIEGEGSRISVPHWMTGWLLATFLNTLGMSEVTSFGETCRLLERMPLIAATPQFGKYREKKELTVDEFIDLDRTISSHVKES